MNVPEDRSQTQSLVHRILRTRGEARRWRFEIIHGIARNVTFHPGDPKVSIEVDGRQISLLDPGGPIAVSDGDSVVVVAGLGDPCVSSYYFNETTGSGSINYTQRQARRMLTAGATAALAAVAILLTTVVAARSESHGSGISALHVLLYIASIIAGGAILLSSCGALAIGVQARKVSTLLKFVIEGR